MKRKTPVKPLPKHFWKRGRSGTVVCQCGRRYGSEFDGLCFDCRGGITAYEAAQGIKEKNPWVGLTDKEKKEIYRLSVYVEGAISLTEAKLKQKNT